MKEKESGIGMSLRQFGITPRDTQDNQVGHAVPP